MQAERRHNGFTIVELLIAAFIIAVGILGWARTQESSIRGRAISNGITTASELGMAKLEELALECQKNAATGTASDTTTAQGVQFTRAWSINQGDILDSTIWVVDVTVSWNHYGPRTVQYQRTVIGD